MNSLVLSIVLPAHNEAKNIVPTYQALVETLEDEELKAYEIIFIDDGSEDDTSKIVELLSQKDNRVKLIQLFRNFGHQIALTAGLAHASGDVVITMDADLQHPPSTIRQMLAKYREGHDVVYCVRQGRQAGLFKNLTSRAFYSFFNRVAGIKLLGNATDFRLMSRAVVDVLNGMREKHRFLRGMTPWIGGSHSFVEYDVAPRLHGSSSYSFNKSLSLAISGLFSFSTFPLKLIFYLGFFFCAMSFSYGLFHVGHKIFIGTAVPGYTDIIASVLFLGGLQLISLGIIGKFMAIILVEVRDRPTYIIKRTVGIDEQQLP